MVRGVMVRGVMVLALVGCGPATPERVDFPSTAMDPPTFVPHQSDEPRTGEVVGIDSGGGHAEARTLTFRFLEALTRQDNVALTGLLSDPVGTVFPELQPLIHPRERRVQRLLETARESGLPPSTDPRELIDVEDIQVERLEGRRDPLPTGYRPDDLVVRFALRPGGIRYLLHLGWPNAQGAMIIRTEPSPRVLAF